MLYLIHHGEATSDAFMAQLTESGAGQAADLSTLLKMLDVQIIYTAPYLRALDTIYPFVHSRKTHNHFCRVEAHYDLHNIVLLPEQRPHGLPLDVVQHYYMNRQSVLGNIPEAENFAEFQRRVLDWFDNEFFQKYKDAPIPTVIIADAMVLGTIVYHLMNRVPYAVAKDVVMQLKPGAAVEFKSDGMHLQYSRVL